MTTTATTRRLPAWRSAGRLIVNEAGMSTEEALTAADLNWTVEKSPLFTDVPEAGGVTRHQMPDHRAVIRRNADGTTQPLGVTGSKFTLIQNATLVETLRDVAEAADATWDSMGCLGDGQTIFGALNLPEGTTIGGRDAIGWTLLGRNGHTGSAAFTLAMTPTRIRCTNMVRATFGNAKRAGHTYSIRHTANAEVRLDEIRAALSLSSKYRQRWTEWAESLMAERMSRQEYLDLVAYLVPMPESAGKRSQTNAERTREALAALWYAPTQDSIQGTRWAAYNAVSEYDQWFRPVRGGDSPDLTRAVRTLEHGQGLLTERAAALLTR